MTSDRTIRFAARMIAVGLLGVAWTVGTLTTVVIHMGTSEQAAGMRWMGYLALAPVALMLVYVILADMADYARHKQVGKQPPADDN